MQDQTASTEQRLAGAMGQIGALDGQMDALKVKRANNSLAATRAQEAASAARDRAGEAKQVGEHWGDTAGGLAGVPLTMPTMRRCWRGRCGTGTARQRSWCSTVQRARGRQAAGHSACGTRPRGCCRMRRASCSGCEVKLWAAGGGGDGGGALGSLCVPISSLQRWRRRTSATSGCWMPRRPSWVGWRPG